MHRTIGGSLGGRVASFTGLLLVLTSYAAAQTGMVRGKVTSEVDGKPVAGAGIRVVGTLRGTVARPDGSYQLRLSPGTYTLQANAIGFATRRLEVTVLADQTTTADITLAEDFVGADEVVVIGSRHSDRTVVGTPVPVDVISLQDIKASGLTETNQVLQMLAPSFNFPRPAIQDGTDHVRPSTLRGLGTDQLLVLVNGKRRHTSAMLNVNSTVGRGSTGVDLNAIPVNAIDRIEILRDGAAAQYGSDAIAGVINIILKSDPGADLSATFGQMKENDGKSVTTEVDYGIEIGEEGFLHASGTYRDRGATNRAGIDTRQQYFDGDPRNDDPTRNNRVDFRFGDAKTEDAGLFLNSSVPIAADLEAYGFGGLTYRTGESGGFYRIASDDRNVREIYPDGFLPLIASTILDASVSAGVKGELSDWLWDLNGTYGRNGFDFDVRNSLNASYGAASPTSFHAGRVTFSQIVTSLDVTRQIDIGLAVPMLFATGLEFRVDAYRQEAGEEASWKDGGVPILDGPNAGSPAPVGSQVFPGYQPSDEADITRNNIAFYLDLSSDLTENLLLDVAGRLEQYSDFGSTINGKGAIRYEPVTGYALRGALSTGFRAPSVVQQYYSSTSTDFIGGNPVEIRTFPVGSPQARALGAQDLKPEKSVNMSIGFAAEPVSNLLLSADYYNIRVNDRIVLSENFIGPDIDSLLAPFNVSGGRFFTNAIDTRTQGLDLILRYALDAEEIGRFIFTGAFNLTRTEVIRVSPTPPQLAGYDETLFGHIERTRIESGQPKDNINLALNYTVGNFGLTLRTIRFGETIEPYPYNPSEEPTKYDQTFAAKWTTDIDLSYIFLDRIKLAVGGSNIFDVYPDKYIVVPDDPYNGLILPYSVFTPFGFNGAFFYARVDVQIM